MKNCARPRDVLRAELIRLRSLRQRRYGDPLLEKRLRAVLDRRIDGLLDELGAA